MPSETMQTLIEEILEMDIDVFEFSAELISKFESKKVEKVINISEASQDGMRWTPRQCLVDCIVRLEKDDNDMDAFQNATGVLVVALDDSNDNFIISYSQSNLKSSKIIALCQCVSNTMVDYIGF